MPLAASVKKRPYVFLLGRLVEISGEKPALKFPRKSGQGGDEMRKESGYVHSFGGTSIVQNDYLTDAFLLRYGLGELI